MLIIVWKSQFKKDFKLVTKRQKKLDKLQCILNELQYGRPLPAKIGIINLKVIMLKKKSSFWSEQALTLTYSDPKANDLNFCFLSTFFSELFFEIFSIIR